MLDIVMLVLVSCALVVSVLAWQTLRSDLERNKELLREAQRQAVLELGQRLDQSTSQTRVELGGRIDRLREELGHHLRDVRDGQAGHLAQVALRIERLSESNRESLDAMRTGVEQRIRALQDDNAAKLEQMRLTVDEKLQGTLEKRLGESFKQVSERLELVHKGLGEMQSLAHGVGDLKKVLANVKMRGGWGEVQLGRILEEFLAPAQYERNVRIDPASNEHVEFALRMPRTDGPELWLALDSKFPLEDYQRLVDASERAEPVEVEHAAKQLEAAVRKSAKDIGEKYIRPPHSVDFAVMFLPTEGLYAEIVRRPGLVDAMLSQHRVMLAGPTNLYALLTTVQATHRSVILQKRSAEVWQLLGAVKTEFGSYGKVLAHVKKKLQEAAHSVDKVETRKRVMERALRAVESASPEQRVALLGEDEEDVAGV